MTRIAILMGACLLASCATVEDTGLGTRGTEKRCEEDIEQQRTWGASAKCGGVGGGCQPSAEIMGDGIDQDCDTKDNCYEDLDHDGWGSAVVIQTNNGCQQNGKAVQTGDCQDVVGCDGDSYFPGNPKGQACGSGEDFDCDVNTCPSDSNCGCGQCE